MPVVGNRNLATGAVKPSSFREKSFKEAWCSDVGAYPVMGVIVFACAFSTGAGLWFMFTHPDSRISKTSRKSLFRGKVDEH